MPERTMTVTIGALSALLLIVVILDLHKALAPRPVTFLPLPTATVVPMATVTGDTGAAPSYTNAPSSGPGEPPGTPATGLRRISY